jgi:hypothetical protein
VTNPGIVAEKEAATREVRDEIFERAVEEL